LDRTDRSSLDQLIDEVAVALFRREMGRPPASPAEAVKRYLSPPGDAPEQDEAEPVREGAAKE
jgi:hypothetical protein